MTCYERSRPVARDFLLSDSSYIMITYHDTFSKDVLSLSSQIILYK